MQRRTFLKATAALLLPTFRIVERPLPLDLQAFCDNHDETNKRRFDLSRPFWQQEWTYATDSRICIRTKLATCDELIEPTNQAPAFGLWWDELNKGGWRPWPKQSWEPDDDKYRSCPVCKGRQPKDADECEACGGCGERYPVGVYVGDFGERCDACHGNGWTGGTTCNYCGGNDLPDDKPCLQRVGHSVIDGYYDSLVRSLGSGVEYLTFPTHTLDRTKPHEVIGLRHQYGQGLVCGIERTER